MTRCIWPYPVLITSYLKWCITIYFSWNLIMMQNVTWWQTRKQMDKNKFIRPTHPAPTLSPCQKTRPPPGGPGRGLYLSKLCEGLIHLLVLRLKELLSPWKKLQRSFKLWRKPVNEEIVNSRPSAQVNGNIENYNALTPNHIYRKKMIKSLFVNFNNKK